MDCIEIARLVIEGLLGLLGLCFFTHKKRKLESQFSVTVEKIVSFGIDNELSFQLSAVRDEVVRQWGKDIKDLERGQLYHVKMLHNTVAHAEDRVQATIKRYAVDPPKLLKWRWATGKNWRTLTTAKTDLAYIKGERRRAMQELQRLRDAVAMAGKRGG